MKEIKIAARLRPYSKVPGITLLLPGTSFALQIFPTLIKINDLSTGASAGSIQIKLAGAVSDFTVIQDLERCQVQVFGFAAGDYFRYLINWDGIKILKGNLVFEMETNLFENAKEPSQVLERLSLGCHKAQDWDLIRRRFSMDEIFPFWLRLGALTPEQPIKTPYEGTAKLLCQENNILASFQNLFRAGFSGLLLPRIEDEQHQGFHLPPVTQSYSPLILLTEGARLIRRLFVQMKQDSIAILPALPPQFHAGRLIGIDCSPFGQLDIEWSKKEIRRLFFRSTVDGALSFTFPRSIKSFRLDDRRIPAKGCIEFKKKHNYYFDQFQKG